MARRNKQTSIYSPMLRAPGAAAPFGTTNGSKCQGKASPSAQQALPPRSSSQFWWHQQRIFPSFFPFYPYSFPPDLSMYHHFFSLPGMRLGVRRAEIILRLSNEDSNLCQCFLALTNFTKFNSNIYMVLPEPPMPWQFRHIIYISFIICYHWLHLHCNCSPSIAIFGSAVSLVKCAVYHQMWHILARPPATSWQFCCLLYSPIQADLKFYVQSTLSQGQGVAETYTYPSFQVTRRLHPSCMCKLCSGEVYVTVTRNNNVPYFTTLLMHTVCMWPPWKQMLWDIHVTPTSYISAS